MMARLWNERYRRILFYPSCERIAKAIVPWIDCGYRKEFGRCQTLMFNRTPPPPRSKTSPLATPSSLSSPRKKVRSDLQTIEDPSVFAAVLFKEKKKIKSNVRSEARDKKMSRFRMKPQAQSAISALSGFSISDHQQSFSYGGQVIDPSEFSELLWQPQMWPALGITNPLTVSVDNDVKTMVSDLQKSFDSFNVTVGNIQAKVGLDVDTQKTVVSASAVLTDFATVILIIAVVWVIKPQTKNEKVLVLVMISGFLLTRLPLKEFFTNSSLFNWLRKEDTVVPQSYGIGMDDSLSTVLVSLINTYVCASKGIEIFKPQVFVKTMGDLSRVGGTVTGMIRGMSLVVNYVYSSIDAWYNGTPFFIKTGHAFINAFLTEATEIISSFEKKELHNVQSSVDRVKAALDHGMSLQMKIPSTAEFAGIRVCLLKHLDELTKIRKSLMASNFRFSGIRQEPATLFLRGSPGTMKSQAMQHISHAINAMTLSGVEFDLYAEQPGSQVYNRQAENVFWDGYAMHNVALFDDVLQARDVQGNPDNEAMNVIRAVNVFEYNLHMAELSSKGNTNFRSKFVILNSNMQNMHLESINDIGAFLRRMDLTYDVCPRAEYCANPNASVWERRFDVSLFPKWKDEDLPADKKHLVGTTRTHPEMCDFHLMKLNTRAKQFEPTGVIHSFKDIVESYYKVYLLKRDRHDSYMLTLDATLYDTRNQYFPTDKVEEIKKMDEVLFELDMFSLPNDDEDQYVYSPQSGRNNNFMPGVEILPDNSLPDSFSFRVNERAMNLDFDEDEDREYNLFMSIDPLDQTNEGFPKRLEQETFDRLMLLYLHNANAFEFVSHAYLRCGRYRELYVRFMPEKVYLGIILNCIERYLREEFQIDLSSNRGTGWIEKSIPEECMNPVHKIRIQERVFKMLYHYVDDEILERFRPQGGVQSKDLEVKSADDLISALERDLQVRLLEIKSRNLAEYLAVSLQIVRMIISGQTRTGSVVLPNDAARAVLDYHAIARFGMIKEDSISDQILDECFKTYQDSVVSTEPVRLSLIGKAKSDLSKWNEEKVSPWLKTIWDLYQSCLAFIITDDDGNTRLYASPEYRIKIGAVIAAVAGFGGAIKLVRSVLLPSIKAFWSDEAAGQSDERRARNPPRSRIGRLIKQKPQLNNGGAPTVPHSVAQSNVNLVSIIDMVLRRSNYTFYAPASKEEREEGDSVKLGFALAIRGRSLLMPHHFVSYVNAKLEEGAIEPTDLCTLMRGCKVPDDTGTAYFQFTAKELIDGYVEWDRGERNDLAMIRLPRRYQPSKDIVSHFASEKQHDHYKKVEIVLAIPIISSKEFHSSIATFSKNIPIGSDEYEPYEVSEAYGYVAHTNPGDCGAICYVNDKSSPSLIIGMHVAGITSKRYGISAKISREFLEEGLKIAGEDYQHEDLPPIEVVGTDRVPPQMDAVGAAAPGVPVPRRITKTCLRESPIKDLAWVSTKAPARLLPFILDGQLVDPFDIALKKYGTADIYINPLMLSAATDSLKDFIFSNSNWDVERRVYTFEEAVVGDGPGSEFSSLPRGTSAGYPYNCCSDKYGTKKARFFGLEGDFDFDNSRAQALKASVKNVEFKARAGIRCNHVFTDSLKDERRALEKVRIGKTRMFSGCPTELLIISRQYFGAFQKWIILNRIDNGMAIGINEYSSEWHLLATRLEQFGKDVPNVGAGDYEGFDMKAKPVVMQAVLDIIQEFYDDGEENRRVREILWLELTNSLHVNRGVFSYWASSLPSGHPLTAIVNCMNNHLLFRMCWYKVFEEAHTFNKYAYLCVLGDDNVYSVRKELVGQFNERTLQDHMKSLGQNYTPEDKESQFGEFLRHIDQVTFLKRKFRKYRGQYIAPLDLETVMDIPNWVKAGPNYCADTEANVQTALEELTLHGIEIFDFHKKKLVQALRTAGLAEPECTSYQILFQRVRERELSQSPARSFLFDYGIVGGKNAEPQIGNERLQEGQAGLFSLTSKMACWQPQLYLGVRKPCDRLIHRRIVKRIATSTTSGDPSQNGVPIGLGTENRVATVRVDAADVQDDVNSSSTTHSTTQGEVVKGVLERPLLLDARMLNSARTGSSHSVAEFLAKPLVVSTGTFAVGDSLPSLKWSAYVPNDFITLAPFKNKLEGSGAFRGDAHITLMVNANRFQQGRYILAWIPTGGAYNSDIWCRMHAATITQISQLPRVEIDLSCDSEVTLIVPQVTVQGWAQNKAGSVLGNSGKVILCPYSPLVAPTGSTTAAYTIYVHFENVEIAVPLAPQSGARVKTKIKRKISPAQAEQNSQNMGPIEAGLIKVAQVSGRLSGIPLLSSVAGPVAWGAELAARVASAFGWSRPHNSEHVGMMTHMSLARYTNTDVADNSTKLAYTDKNEIESVPGFAGTDLDEMSLSYVSTISARINSVTWSSSDAVNTRLIGFACSPRDYYSQTTQGGVTLSHLSPMTFVSSFFTLYRGSIKFTFKIVKTEFHTGRLQVTFVPADPAGNWPQPNATTSIYYHREIIDIREGNEFSFVAPYTSFSQYRSLAGTDKAYGSVWLDVLTPLIAPSSVSSTVSIIIEVSAADDMEFAVPGSIDMTPVIQFNPQAGKNICEIVQGNIGGSTVSNDEAYARSCIGERIMSFRSILKRFSVFKNVGEGGFTTTLSTLAITPHALHVGMVGSSNLATSPTLGSDLFTRISSCYALARGGIRFKIVDLSSSSVVKYLTKTVSLVSANDYVSTFNVSSSYLTNDANRSSAIFRSDQSGGCEIEVPFYHRYHSAAVGDLMSPDVVTVPQVYYLSSGTAPRTQLVVSQVGNTPVDPLVFRAAAEDFSLGLFVSVPPFTGFLQDAIN